MRFSRPVCRRARIVCRPRRLLAGYAAALALAHGAATAQVGSADEAAVKAAFAYNFAKYTEWPEELWNRPGKLRLCSAGERGALAQAMTMLESKPPLRGKPIEVRHVSDAEAAASCHLLVLAGRSRTPDWLRSLRRLPVLTIGESVGFAAGGGIIGLFMEEDKVKFEINQSAAQRAQLKLSSQLLKLARLVKDESGEAK